MGKLTRRMMLKNAALPIAGTFALPILAKAVQQSSTPFQRPKLKITDVRTAQVRVHGLQTHVRVYSDQGLYGQGRVPLLPAIPHVSSSQRPSALGLREVLDRPCE